MSDKITEVTINNPMCEVFYKFPQDKETFMVGFKNQLAGCGYFMDTAIDGHTVTINPSNCSFIDIREIDFKGLTAGHQSTEPPRT